MFLATLIENLLALIEESQKILNKNNKRLVFVSVSTSCTLTQAGQSGALTP